MRIVKTVAILFILLGGLFSTSTAQLSRQWLARYTSAGKGAADAVTAMAVDNDGNVVVTGYTSAKPNTHMTTIKYSPTGVQLWQVTFTTNGSSAGTAIAIDSGNAIYVTGSVNSGVDIMTVKYNPSGTLAWSNVFDGGQGTDVATCIAVNDSLNCYVTGYSMGASSGYDILTIKYDVNGTLKWVNRYNGPANGDDKGYAMVLLGKTDVFVTGSATDTMLDVATIDYSATTGLTKWASLYNGSGNGDDIGRAIALQGGSTVFVTGSSQGQATGNDYITLRYNGTGVLQWAARYDDGFGGDDQAFALAVDGSSRLYVTGRSFNQGSSFDMTTVKYSFAGVQGWVSSFDGTASDYDSPVAIVGTSNPYVVGQVSDQGLGKDFGIVQYNGSSGAPMWSTAFNGAGNGDDVPADAALFNKDLYVAGQTYNGKTTGMDMVTMRYTDPDHITYRSFVQESLAVKSAALKKGMVNFGNVSDAVFAAAFPKIKSGLPGAPGGMYIGNPRYDSASAYGWIRVDKSTALPAMLPQTGTARTLDMIGTKAFRGEQKDLKLKSYSNKLVGDLIALELSIAASDAEITPSGFGVLVYQDTVVGNNYSGYTLRQLAQYADNVLTYGSYYPSFDFYQLDTTIARVNKAFSGALGVVSTDPVTVAGEVLIDSVSYIALPGSTIAPRVVPEPFRANGAGAGLQEKSEKPRQFALYQNYPNPFNPTTTIQFDLPVQSVVSLKVYDLLGREVAALADREQMSPGRHELRFSAPSYASGIYYYKITANGGAFETVKKMVLIK